MTTRSRIAASFAEATDNWWILLVTGSLWVVVAFAILQFDLTSVWSIAVLTGVVLLLGAVTEFTLTAMAPRWKVAHALLGTLFLIGGFAAFVWPGQTFVVLARLFGWYLIFWGTFEIVESLAYRWELWWLRLIAGIATVAIAFWAVDSLSRSAALLVLWVGIGALMRGLSQFFLAFEWRDLHKQAEAIATSAPEVPRQQVDLVQDRSVRSS